MYTYCIEWYMTFVCYKKQENKWYACEAMAIWNKELKNQNKSVHIWEWKIRMAANIKNQENG